VEYLNHCLESPSTSDVWIRRRFVTSLVTSASYIEILSASPGVRMEVLAQLCETAVAAFFSRSPKTGYSQQGRVQLGFIGMVSTVPRAVL